MKNVAFALLLLQATALMAAPPVNPADFPVVVHVVFSRAGSDAHGTNQQQLQTVIDGQQVEMVAQAPGVLTPGDYQGRMVPNLNGPKKPNGYDIFVGYDLLLPDGTFRGFYVTGLGPKGGSPGALPRP